MSQDLLIFLKGTLSICWSLSNKFSIYLIFKKCFKKYVFPLRLTCSFCLDCLECFLFCLNFYNNVKKKTQNGFIIHGRWNLTWIAYSLILTYAWLIKIVSLNDDLIFSDFTQILLCIIYFTTDIFINSMTFSCIVKFYTSFNIHNVWLSSNQQIFKPTWEMNETVPFYIIS